MRRSKKMVIALVAAGTCGLALAKAGSLLLEPEISSAEHLVNRPWIERMPKNDRDIIGYLVALTTDHGRLGAVGRASQWRHFAEVFRWSLEGERLVAVFPQERMRAEFEVRTWSCKGEAPPPFELCLQISRGQRSHVLYSMEGWEIDDHAASVSGDDSTLSDILAISAPLGLGPTPDVPADELTDAPADWFPTD